MQFPQKGYRPFPSWTITIVLLLGATTPLYANTRTRLDIAARLTLSNLAVTEPLYEEGEFAEGEGELEGEVQNTLTVSPENQTLGAEPADVFFVITCPVSWEATSDAEWATPTPASGTGSGILTVSCQANEGAERIAYITITGEDTTPDSVQVSVQQLGTNSLAVVPSAISVSAASGSIVFSVYTTTAWTLVSDSSWAVPSPLSGEGNSVVTVTYSANTNTLRTARITVTGRDTEPASVFLLVTQAGAPPEGEQENEGEEETPWWETGYWSSYAGIVAVIGLAYGILWLAEDPPSPCVVASAAYGTSFSGEIVILRLFRDRILLKSPVGIAFVDLYYRSGPYLADYVSAHPHLALLIRLVLVPIVAVLFMLLFAPEAGILFFGVTCSLCIGFIMFLSYRKLHKPNYSLRSER